MAFQAIRGLQKVVCAIFAHTTAHRAIALLHISYFHFGNNCWLAFLVENLRLIFFFRQAVVNQVQTVMLACLDY